MTQERTQYGDDAKGQVAWATCVRCGVKDRVAPDGLEPRTNANEIAELPEGAAYFIHAALQALRCVEWKAERERAEGKR